MQPWWVRIRYSELNFALQRAGKIPGTLQATQRRSINERLAPFSLLDVSSPCAALPYAKLAAPLLQSVLGFRDFRWMIVTAFR